MGDSRAHVEARVAVLKVVSRELSATAAAAEYGYSRQHLQRLLARYRTGGLEAVEPRSRRPQTNPRQTSDELRERIVALRLRADRARARRRPGHHRLALEQDGHRRPRPRPSAASSTPRASSPPSPQAPAHLLRRFEAAQPNECWQSDFTHWRLADGTEVEIINWLDDHSRYLLDCTAYRPVTGDDVVATFLAAADAHGWPAATLTDNGPVYTARFTGGTQRLRVPARQPRHHDRRTATPATPRPRARSSASTRPSSAGSPGSRPPDPGRAPGPARRVPRPLQRATAPPGDRPAAPRPGLPRDAQGRPAGTGAPGPLPAPQRHHRHERQDQPPPGRPDAPPRRRRRPRRRRVLAIVDEHEVTVVALDTGEILSTHPIEPDHRPTGATHRETPADGRGLR